MKYMLLIHQGDAPTPRSPASGDVFRRRAEGVYGDYKAINETPGVQTQPPEMATTVRVQDVKTLITDGPFVAIKEALGGTCSSRPTISTRRSTSLRAFRPPTWGGAVEVRPVVER